MPLILSPLHEGMIFFGLWGALLVIFHLVEVGLGDFLGLEYDFDCGLPENFLDVFFVGEKCEAMVG